MSGTPRQPVPRVPPVKTASRSTAHLSGEFPFTEMPKSGPREDMRTNAHHKEKKTMANSINKLKHLIVDNKDIIRQKTLVVVGATAGLLLTTALVERFNRPRVTNVVIYNEANDEVVEPDSGPLEP